MSTPSSAVRFAAARSADIFGLTSGRCLVRNHRFAAGAPIERKIISADVSNAPLRSMLATLGNEGWELLSAVNEEPNLTNPIGLTYLFKRQAR